MVTIGIPRALFYYRYYPLVKAFFDALNVRTVLTEPTTRLMLETGSAVVVGETCLPVKAFCGHLLRLKHEVDFALVPSVRSVEPGLFACVKLFALPDIARAIAGAPPILDFLADATAGKDAFVEEIYRVGRCLGIPAHLVRQACHPAREAHNRYQEMLATGWPPEQAIEAVNGRRPTTTGQPASGEDRPTIAIIGHLYNLHDDYVNHGVPSRLRQMGARLVTAATLSPERLAAGVTRVVGEPYWMCEGEITGAAGHYLAEGEVDGVVVLSAFGCAPDSVIVDALQRYAKIARTAPLLCLTLDEHSANAGLLTRLEAFIDTVNRRRRQAASSKSPRSVVMAPSHGVSPRPHFAGSPKVTLPHMGSCHVAFQVLFGSIGVDMVVPPPYSKRTLDLGTRLSPEVVCLPYKLVLGNMIEALEMGANTPILLSGPNNCRFGYYHKLQDQVLRELGYDFRMLAPEISGRTIKGIVSFLQELSGRPWWECFRAIVLALYTMSALDEIEREVQRLRPIELRRGSADTIWQETQAALALARGYQAVLSLKQQAMRRLRVLPVDITAQPLRVAIVGEIYVVHEPFANHDVERVLARLGVEANRSEQVSQWLIPAPAGILERLGIGHMARIKRAERPFMRYWSGETVGQTVMAEEDGYDGVVQLAPFTCTPEVVAQNILPKLRGHVDIPILTLILDEHTGREGVVTRLEAFVDLLERRRRALGRTSAPSVAS